MYMYNMLSGGQAFHRDILEYDNITKQIRVLAELQAEEKALKEKIKDIKEEIRVYAYTHETESIGSGKYHVKIAPVFTSSLAPEMRDKAIAYAQKQGIYEEFAEFTLSEAKIKAWEKENKDHPQTNTISENLRGYLEMKEGKSRITVKEVEINE